MEFIELNGDQRRETVNTQQRYAAYRDAEERVRSTKGSMVWAESRGAQYLARSYYDKSGVRRQRSLGPRSPETEKLKAEYEQGRNEAQARFKDLTSTIDRQASVNRALRLGRVPLTGARILRALDDAGTLGAGLRVVGTSAILAYEAVAGVHIDPGLLATGDIDFLMDTRAGLKFVVSEEVSERSLIALLRSVDRSFQKSNQAFRAQNSEGYLVDLIKPMRAHPSKPDKTAIGNTPADLAAAEIEGLIWLENAPAFESIAIDEKGYPLRIVSPDPRVWAAHKLWMSKRPDREPIKRQRDFNQATTVGKLVAGYLTHLPYDGNELKMLPKDVFEAARTLFEK